MIQVFFVLLRAEIFVPGGVLGAIGGIALIGAALTGMWAFPGFGLYIAVGIVVLTGVAVALWIKLFPRSGMGRRMTVATDMRAAKATEDGLEALLGREGEARSDLRPGGFAMIEGRRVDVISEGGLIARGTLVRVVEIEGNRVVVRAVEPIAGKESASCRS